MTKYIANTDRPFAVLPVYTVISIVISQSYSQCLPHADTVGGELTVTQ